VDTSIRLLLQRCWSPVGTSHHLVRSGDMSEIGGEMEVAPIP
jgi:hypothetical protein